jgi:hypothetical protein
VCFWAEKSLDRAKLATLGGLENAAIINIGGVRAANAGR